MLQICNAAVHAESLRDNLPKQAWRWYKKKKL